MAEKLQAGRRTFECFSGSKMKVAFFTVIIIAILVLSGSSCNKTLDGFNQARSDGVVANGFILTDYQDCKNGNVIYYLYCVDTDVMYVENRVSGYSSSFVPIYKPDGTLFTYSEWIKERTDN